MLLAPPLSDTYCSLLRSALRRSLLPGPNPEGSPGVVKRLCRLAALCLGLLLPLAASGQELDVDPALVQEVFPGAARVGSGTGDPPVYPVFGPDSETGKEVRYGYLFLTSDWPPEESGYSGTILSLVGLDMQGMITGARILEYHESLRSSRGDFLRGYFEKQFAGKRLGDPFRVRRDVDNVSGATISTAATARGIRNAARRVAAAHLFAGKGPLTPEEIEQLSWPELVLRNLGDRLQGIERGLLRIELYLVPLKDEAMGRTLMGDAYDKAATKLGARMAEKQVWMVGVDGGLEALFRASALKITRGTDTLKFTPQDIALTGEPRSGKVDGQFRNIGLILLDPSIDLKQPFTWHLVFGGGMAPYSAEHVGERKPVVAKAPAPAPAPATDAAPDSTAAAVPAETAAADAAPTTTAADSAAAAAAEAVAAAPLIDQQLVDFAAEEEESVLQRTLDTTDWRHFGIIAFVLALATAAFFAKNTLLRWISLGTTLLVLGFASATQTSALGGGGFLSISHITSAIKVGPKVFLEDLPLLLFVVFTVVTTLLWGRVFCGYLCPFGALQDFMEHVVPKKLRAKLPHPVHESGLYAKYGIMGVILLWAFVGPEESSIFQYFEPFGTVFFWSKSAVLWVIAGAVLVASAIIPRFYCRYMCPLGASLAVASLLSPFRIKRVQQCQVCTVCEHACPTGAILRETIDFKECVRCNVCEVKLIEKAGVCRHDVERVAHLIQIKGGRHTKHQPVPIPEPLHGD
jgi:NosR/NirI family nitrous oxide reductase transcriptional regulator